MLWKYCFKIFRIYVVKSNKLWNSNLLRSNKSFKVLAATDSTFCLKPICDGDTRLEISRSHDYYYECQSSLQVCDRDKCYLVLTNQGWFSGVYRTYWVRGLFQSKKCLIYVNWNLAKIEKVIILLQNHHIKTFGVNHVTHSALEGSMSLISCLFHFCNRKSGLYKRLFCYFMKMKNFQFPIINQIWNPFHFLFSFFTKSRLNSYLLQNTKKNLVNRKPWV